MTPRHLEVVTRILLFGLTLITSVLIAVESVAPSLGSPIIRLTTHIMLAYGALSLALLSFSRRRRTDLFLVCVVQFAVFELARFYLGRPDSMAGGVADLAGLIGVYLPTELEHHRRLARTHGFMTYSEIRASDRRRGGLQSLPARSRGLSNVLRA